jgi:alkylation response protein AidB-like acyl-CoA dehydrogenase
VRVPGPEELERRLGEPWDKDNPLGFDAVLSADEQAEILSAGERELDAYGMGAEFVPVEQGGRLSRLDRLIDVTRTVVRRDPVLGFGYGTSSLMAAVNVWTSGTPGQRRTVADLLLEGGRLACAFHELAHGNDLTHAAFTAARHTGGLLLNGRKQVVGNLQRADAMVLFARTGHGQGSRSHSQLLIDKAALPSDGFRYLPRHHTSGLRGMELGGMEFINCPLPADTVVGAPGQGIETALRAFQVTRIAVSGMTVGVLDTALRTSVRFADGRRLYGRTVADLPYPRSILADAFADLLLADCFTVVAARAAHILPRETAMTAAAVKYLVPMVLAESAVRLSNMVGAQFYLRQGDHALMQKLVRDVQPAAIVHASRATCLMTLLPQLPGAAKRSWLSGEQAPAEVFRPGGDLPALSFDQLAVGSNGMDRLGASLLAAADELSGDPAHDPELRRLAEFLGAELRELARACATLPRSELSVSASRRSYRLAHRYAVLLAASSCLNVWRNVRGGADDFLSHPGWLIAVLTRLADRLDRGRWRVPPHVGRYMYEELASRYGDSTSFDLANRRLSAWRQGDRP